MIDLWLALTWSNMGFTNFVYCAMTLSTSLPLETVSRLILLASLRSSSVSTKIFMFSAFLTSSMCNTMIPSMITTSPGFTSFVSVSLRWCVVKSYTGILTGCRFLSCSMHSRSAFLSKASGWSKLYSDTFASSSLVRPR